MFSKLTLPVFVCCLFYSSFAIAEPVRLSDDEGLQGQFTQLRYLDGFEQPIRSTGDFYVAPNVGLIWQTRSPIASRMEIDEDGIRQTVQGGEVAYIRREQVPALEILRSALEQSLAGNWEYLETLAGSKWRKSADRWILEYQPAEDDAGLPFEKIVFEIGAYLDRVEVIRKQGDRDIISFKDHIRRPKSDILKEFSQGSSADQ